jgi:hypothetical protein
MAKTYKDDAILRPYRVKNFSGGYNSYTASKSNLDDDEFPVGQNVELDDNGSVKKSPGSQEWGPEINSGFAITGMGLLKNTTYNHVIVSSGTGWYYNSGSAKTLLTGVTFTTSLDTDFAQAVDRLYGANGTDKLAYTADGSTITEQTSNGNIGRWPTPFNQRLYMTNTANPDRVYYSNPYAYATATASYTLSNFGTFDTDLNATPKKNAGFIILMPGAGVVVTRLLVQGDYLFAYTRAHGVWKIGAVSTANADGSIAHTVTQSITYGGAPSGRGICVNGNDQWYFGDDGIYAYGEVATYQSPRRTTKSGRIRTEIESIATAGKNTVAMVTYNDTVYVSYMTGTYNDRLEKYINRLNVFSAPTIGVNVSCFLEYRDNNGIRRLLAGSADSASSYVYEVDTGTSFAGSVIDAYFQTKSYDCNKPGLIKYFGFIDVFYTLISGQLTYEVFIDQVSSITGTQQLGTSATGTVGVGSLMVGTFMVGSEFTSSSSTGTTVTNGSFRIECDYSPGKQIAVQFSNANLSEGFKIDSMVIYEQDGDIYQTS